MNVFNTCHLFDMGILSPAATCSPSPVLDELRANQSAAEGDIPQAADVWNPVVWFCNWNVNSLINCCLFTFGGLQGLMKYSNYPEEC